MTRKNLFEGIVKSLLGDDVLTEDQNPIIAADEDISRPQDGLEIYTGPGIIVALVRYLEPDVSTEVNEQEGVEPSTCGFYQIPIGAVDNFRFYKVNEVNSLNSMRDTTSDRFPDFQEIWKKYSIEKGRVIESWKEQNPVTYENLKNEFGDNLMGADVIPNDKKKIEPPKEDKDQKKHSEDTTQGVEDGPSSEENASVETGIGDETASKDEKEQPTLMESFVDNDKDQNDATNSQKQSQQDQLPETSNFHECLGECIMNNPTETLVNIMKCSGNCIPKIIGAVKKTKSGSIIEGDSNSQALRILHRDNDIPVSGGRIYTSGNGKRYLVLSFSNDGSQQVGTTLEQLRSCLTEGNVKRLSKDIAGVFAVISQNTISKDADGNPIFKAYPISNVNFNKETNTINFTTDSRQEVKAETKARESQFT